MEGVGCPLHTPISKSFSTLDSMLGRQDLPNIPHNYNKGTTKDPNTNTTTVHTRLIQPDKFWFNSLILGTC